MASVQCKLLNLLLKTFVKPKFKQFAKSTSPKQQHALIQDVRKKMQWFAIPPSANAMLEEIQIGNIPGIWVRSNNVAATRTILYLHGGGYATGSSKLYLDLAHRLADACAAQVLLIDYRLAPEHSISCALTDTLTTYEWLLANGTAANSIMLAGDSAGGGLALATLVALRDRSIALPRSAICFSPWTDLCATGKSIKNNYHNDPYIIVPEKIAFLSNINKTDPYVSPLYANLQGLPSILIQVGNNEALLDDSRQFAAKAKASGVSLELQIWQEVPHVWQIFAKYLPEGQQAIDAVGKFVNKI